MVDDAYVALSDRRRRALLSELLDAPVVDVSSLLTDRPDSTHHISLHHWHLPLLSEMGYVVWDLADGTVTRGPRFDTVRPLIEFHRDEFGTWNRIDASGNDAGTGD